MWNDERKTSFFRLTETSGNIVLLNINCIEMVERDKDAPECCNIILTNGKLLQVKEDFFDLYYWLPTIEASSVEEDV